MDRNASTDQENTGDQYHLVRATSYPCNGRVLTITQTEARPKIPDTMPLTVSRSHATLLGESPPLPPKACFGRDDLIEEIVGLAEDLAPIALIGAGGIGKTSIALAVLHHDRIKQRFGDNRRFIRCDQFPASRTHLLARLSKAIGAGVENPEDLTPLRPFLSSTDMILILDNAESILDPQGADAQEMYGVVEELSRFSNICLGITSRISAVPPCCKIPTIPTLSIDAARDAFYYIYGNGKRTDLVDKILGQLDSHLLSLTLLATVAYHSKWDNNRLAKEWDGHRKRALWTDHSESLAAMIELSLASPMFRKLGPDARDLLSVVAFFPQGINENNLGWLFPTRTASKWLFPMRTAFKWLFPTPPDRRKMLDKFCALSLTYRSNGFVMMLAPLRDYFCPKDPRSSPLLCTIKERYFHRLSVFIDPEKPGFDEAQWITSEDLNVEHLLDIFTTIDAGSHEAWAACGHFLEHLHWHKTRLVMLGPKIEGLPDDHTSKPECLLQLSWLFSAVGNDVEKKRLLTHILKHWRQRGDDLQVARTLECMCNANRMLGLNGEGIQQAREALGIYERLNHISGQAQSLRTLAWLLYDDKQLNAAEEAALRAIDLLSGRRERFVVCECYRVLSLICCSRGETEKAIDHIESAFKIASRFNWNYQLFWCNYQLADLFFKQGRLGDAHASVERAKSYTINHPSHLGRAMQLQAEFWYEERKFDVAESAALRAADVYERLGAARDLESCKALLRNIEGR